MDDEKLKGQSGRIRLEPKVRGRGSSHSENIDYQEGFEIKSFDGEKFIKKNVIRLVVAIIIFTIVFAVQSLPFAMAQKVSQGVKWAVSYQMNWKEDILEKKDIVPAIGNQISKFMGVEKVAGGIDENEQYISPVEGVVTAPFGEMVHPVFKTKIEAKGIEISGDSARQIRAIEKGKVVQVQDSLYGGKRIIIEHDSTLKSIYEGCYESSVEVNQEINHGDILGQTKVVEESEASVFYFELWKGDTAVNPADYINLEVEPGLVS